CVLCYVFFFFQAEDGIRDRNVTGVQTCALPIYHFYFGKENQYSPICRRNVVQQTLQFSIQPLPPHFLIDVAVMDHGTCQVVPVITARNLKYIALSHITHHLSSRRRGHDDDISVNRACLINRTKQMFIIRQGECIIFIDDDTVEMIMEIIQLMDRAHREMMFELHFDACKHQINPAFSERITQSQMNFLDHIDSRTDDSNIKTMCPCKFDSFKNDFSLPRTSHGMEQQMMLVPDCRNDLFRSFLLNIRQFKIQFIVTLFTFSPGFRPLQWAHTVHPSETDAVQTVFDVPSVQF